MKRSNLFIIAIITMFALSFGMPTLDVSKPIGDCLTISMDSADAKSYSRSSSRSSFSRSSSSKSWGSSSSKKSSSSGGWFSSKPKAAPKKSSFSSSAKPAAKTTAGKTGYTNSAAKKAPTKAYTNSSGAKAAATSSKPAGKKSAFSTASKTGSSATALKKYQAPKAGKSGYKSKSGATYKPQYTGSDYSRNYSSIRYDNRPVWVNSSPYSGMWTTLLVMHTLNSMERERHMMMLRSDPRYMSFYNEALTNPHMDPALRAQLLATNNMAYASAGRPVGSSSSFIMIFGVVLTLCIVGGVIIAVRRS